MIEGRGFHTLSLAKTKSAANVAASWQGVEKRGTKVIIFFSGHSTTNAFQAYLIC